MQVLRVWHCIQEAYAFLEAFRDDLEDINMAFLKSALMYTRCQIMVRFLKNFLSSS